MRKTTIVWATCFLFALTTDLSASSSRSSDATPEVASTEDLIGRHLRSLDRELQKWLHLVERRGIGDEARWQLERDRLGRTLRYLERRIETLEASDVSLLRDQAGAIGRKLQALERAARIGPMGKAMDRRAEPVVRLPLVKGVPTNDDCANALAIGDGTFLGTTVGATNDGASTCGGSGAPDVWFRYSSPVGGTIFADTLGSDFDTVLSVHTLSCPASNETELSCNNNSTGLQSALPFFSEPGEEVLIRVSGFGGATGSYALNIGPGGAVSGKVVDAATGAPLASVEVRFVQDSYYISQSVVTDPAGNYTAAGLHSGTFYAIAGASTTFVPELYQDVPCPEADCDLDLGTPIEVTVGSVTQGIDFALELGGTLAGTVTDAVSGQPIHSVELEIFDAQGRSIRHTHADIGGHYSFTGLAAGSYFVRSGPFGTYRNEVYDNIPCGSSCDPTLGTPIQVNLGATIANIDFALEQFGAISGVVTDADSGESIPFIDVAASQGSLNVVSSGFTDELGRYTIGGLVEGSYTVRTRGSSDHQNELYDDIPCPDESCDLDLATLVPVEFNATTPNIDFALDRLGSITGVVTHEATGEPLPFYLVEAFGASDFAFESTDEEGRYTLSGLNSDTYSVFTFQHAEFQDELYDDIPCPFGACQISSGTPVAVFLGTTTSEIDFALQRFASISGTVTAEATGDPIPFVSVLALDEAGTLIGSTTTGTAGNYVFDRLPPGTYLIRTDQYAPLFRDELYDDIPCELGVCDLESGTPIRVEFESAVRGIDFALQRLGSISGTVTEEATGAPLPGRTVVATDGFSTRLSSTDPEGHYVIEGLLTGDYFVLVEEYLSDFLTELYDDIPCPLHGCDPTQGTPVTVSPATTTPGIDFELRRLGAMTGKVTDAISGAPIPSAFVDVFDASGSYVKSEGVDSQGRYRVSRLGPGTYFARAGQQDDYVRQLHAGIPCSLGVCDPTIGTPIVVALESTTEGIDFALQPSGGLSGKVESAVTGERLEGTVNVWDASGRLLTSRHVGPEGLFRIQGLATGPYFVTTHRFFSDDPMLDYDDELYDDLPCPNGNCDPTTGSAVLVSQGAVTPDVDFALRPIVTGSCVQAYNTLCLNNDRFRVEASWRDFLGQSGEGRIRRLTEDTGYFWFFTASNVELVVKVLDGCFDPFNTFWVFAGGLTDVEVELTVTDTVTGEVRTYSNALGSAFAPIQDLAAFATCDATGPAAELIGRPEPFVAAREVERLATELGPSLAGAGLDRAGLASAGLAALAPEATAPDKSTGDCLNDAKTLCLSDDRFEVTALWDTGQLVGDGRAFPLTDDTGYFWFFSHDNVEVVVKVLDACSLPGFENFWVFAAGLTDVEVTLRVTDTVTQEVREWVNPLDTPFQPIRETGAFRSCP